MKMAKKGFIPWNIGTSKTKVTIMCENCGKMCEKYLCGRNRVRFCSNKCAHIFMPSLCKGKFGKEHPKWKNEKKKAFRKSLRDLNSYKIWRDEVFNRDNFTCNNCGYRGGYLEAHHIIPFAKILNENKVETYDDALLCKQLWNIDNGITYCLKCHIKKDKRRNI